MKNFEYHRELVAVDLRATVLDPRSEIAGYR